MTSLRPRPKYADLPVVPGAPSHSAWGLYGAADERGALNLLTPARVADAALLVRSGRQFRLDLPLHEPDPPFFSRQPLRHEVMQLLDVVLDDRLDDFYPQASTQWDALSHYAASGHGFYNGRSVEEARAGALSIEAMAGQGLAGRGVLADVARHAAAIGHPLDPADASMITVELLRDTLAAQGTTLRTGDLLLVRTGWLGWYLALDREARERVAAASRGIPTMRIPGLGPAALMAEFLWDSGVAMVASDTPMVEVYPVGAIHGAITAADINDTLHARAMALLGIPLGEFFVLDPLADDCRQDSRWEFFFTSAPLRLRGGIGSPPNAIAFK